VRLSITARRFGTIAALAVAATAGCSSGGVCPPPDAGDAPRADDAAIDDGEGAVITEYDLGGAFSIARNPNGPWRYGYTQGTALSTSAFALDTNAVEAGAIGFWHPSDSDYYPYVAGNATGTTAIDATGSWAVRSHEVALEASGDGRYSVVQFVAPATATYDIQADFTGIHSRLSSTDVHVLHGDVAIFDAAIDGYGGDPTLHAVEGASPRARYQEARLLASGDVLGFAVGVGPNGTNFNDTTGLIVHIVARN
jgi:hypothetical protein